MSLMNNCACIRWCCIHQNCSLDGVFTFTTSKLGDQQSDTHNSFELLSPALFFFNLLPNYVCNFSCEQLQHWKRFSMCSVSLIFKNGIASPSFYAGMLFSLPEAAFRPNQMLLQLAQKEKSLLNGPWTVCEYSARSQAPNLVAATLLQRLPPATTNLQSISPPLVVQSPGSTILFEAPSNRIETDTECVTSTSAYNKTWKGSIISIIEVDYILSISECQLLW